MDARTHDSYVERAMWPIGRGDRKFWISVVVLLLLNVTTYYNTAQAPWLYGTVALIVALLIRDRYRRKNAWRDE